MTVVTAAVELGVVPAFLVFGVVAALAAAGRARFEHRPRAYAGFWLGLLLTVVTLMVLAEIGAAGTRPSTGQLRTVAACAGFVAGTVAGAIGPLVFDTVRERSTIGLVALLQTWVCSSLLVAYAVCPAIRVLTVWFTIAAATASCAAAMMRRPATTRSLDRRRPGPTAHAPSGPAGNHP